MPRQISFGGSKWDYYGQAPRNLVELELIEPAPFEISIVEVRAKLEKKMKKVTVTRDLAMAHPIIRKLLDSDIPRRSKYLTASYKSSFDAPYFDSPFEQRRLRLLNSLFLSLEKTDVRVSSSGKNPHEFNATVGLTSVIISIDDPKVERTSWHGASDLQKAASSPLVAKIDRGTAVDGIKTTWQDKSDDRMEAHLTDIVLSVLVTGENTCRAKEISHYRWLVKHKADLIERARREREKAEAAERERLIKEENERIHRLLSEAKALREAEDIRAYVASVMKSNEGSAAPVSDQELRTWADWALAQANRIDPVLSRRFLERQ
jgi:hypothetical protein